MEYLYIAMFLQEVGREINEANIQKIFAALNMEADDAKVRLLIPALSILTNANLKKVKRATDSSLVQQLTDLQKRFEVLGNSMTKNDERLVGFQREQSVICEDSMDKEMAKEVVKPERTVKIDPVQRIESKGADIMTEVVSSGETTHELPARYVYGVVDKGERENLGAIGLEGAEVYTISYKDMSVIVHDCLAKPYQSDNEEKVKDWLFTQQEVLDVAMEKFGVVLPMSFDMIIEEKNWKDSEQAVIGWLVENYDDFQEKMARLRNKQEFGVQVLLEPEVLSYRLIETDEKLRAKKKEIDSKSEGMAYLEREILKELVKEKIEEKADQYLKSFTVELKNAQTTL